jgi:superfamily II DNA or RNA helicase
MSFGADHGQKSEPAKGRASEVDNQEPVTEERVRGKKVVFLAPTHALVEQLTEDLQGIFPKDQFGLEVSSDFDSLLFDDSQLQDIEVMTPERCLARLSFSASSFQSVGLLVFDECHLLSPQSGKIGRALDGMLCLLTFSAVAPYADMLLLSAMLKNGPDTKGHDD